MIKKLLITTMLLCVVAGALNAEPARLAIYAPKPEYPREARARRIQGTGVVAVDVDKNGNVTDCKIVRSTGSPVLDNSMVAAFRRWRFKPGARSREVVPLTFTMAKGASY
jgi:TonB family protein